MKPKQAKVGKRSNTKKRNGIVHAAPVSGQRAQVKDSTVKKKNGASHIAFRPYKPADQQWIVDLTQRELGQIFAAAYQTQLTPFQVQQMLQMGQQTNIILYQSKPIGYYSFFSDDSLKRHISSLVIDKTKQRKGIGTDVMKKIEQQAKQDGIRVLEVFIQSPNKACIAFTEKLGFQYAEPPYINTICMQKFIK